MMKRKFYALLLAGAMLLSLTVCGTNAASPSDNGTDNGADASQPPETTPSADPAQTDTTAAPDSQTIKLTLDGDEGTREITAALMDTPAAAEFAGHMPFTVEMHEHLDRQKEVYLDFSLSEESQTNSVHEQLLSLCGAVLAFSLFLWYPTDEPAGSSYHGRKEICMFTKKQSVCAEAWEVSAD